MRRNYKPKIKSKHWNYFFKDGTIIFQKQTNEDLEKKLNGTMLKILIKKFGIIFCQTIPLMLNLHCTQTLS
jgi:hypothetical protein